MTSTPKDLHEILRTIMHETAQTGNEIAIMGDQTGIIYRVTGNGNGVRYPHWAEEESTWSAHTHPAEGAPSPQDVLTAMESGNLNFVVLPSGLVYQFRATTKYTVSKRRIANVYRANYLQTDDDNFAAQTHAAFDAVCQWLHVEYKTWQL